MRHVFVRAAIVGTLLTGSTLAWALSTGPPASRTGAFAVANKAAESNCTLCHTGSPLNDPSGRLELLGVPAQYEANAIYPIRIRLTHAWSPLPPQPLRWGFEITAVAKATGDSAGFWVRGANTPPDTFKLQKPAVGAYNKRWYLSHTRDVTNPVDPDGSTRYGASSPVEWVVNWKAPAGDSGKVYFFAAGNSSNGDGVSVGSGDFIFTAVDSTTYGSNVDVPSHPSPLQLTNALDAPFPNPMVKCTSIDFTIARGGLVDLAVFDVQGRQVRGILHGFRSAGTHGTYWDGRQNDGSFARNGLYFLRLKAPGDGRTYSRRITLAR